MYLFQNLLAGVSVLVQFGVGYPFGFASCRSIASMWLCMESGYVHFIPC